MIPSAWHLGIALLPLVGLALELLLVRLRWTPYFQAGFPLHLELVPIPALPEGAGQTASVCWLADDEGGVRWWARWGTGEGLTGLHGAVRCVPTRRGVALLFRWSPPWSPLLGAIAVGIYGAVRGLPALSLPVGFAMIFGLILVYYQGAIRAAAELRWSFVQGAEARAAQDRDTPVG